MNFKDDKIKKIMKKRNKIIKLVLLISLITESIFCSHYSEKEISFAAWRNYAIKVLIDSGGFVIAIACSASLSFLFFNLINRKQVANFLKKPNELKDFAETEEVMQLMTELYDCKEKEIALRQRNTRCTPIGVLLYGRPGTGKTEFVKWLAKEKDAFFCDLSNVVGSHYGEKEEKITYALDNCKSSFKKGNNIVILLDEANAYIGQDLEDRRNQTIAASENRLKQLFKTFMTETVEMNSNNKDKHIVIVFTTNMQDGMDDALLRQGRMNIVHNFRGSLNEKDLEEILKKRYDLANIKENILDISTFNILSLSPHVANSIFDELEQNKYWRNMLKYKKEDKKKSRI